MKRIELSSNLVPIFSGTYYTIWGDEDGVEYYKYFKMRDIVEAYDNWSDEILDTFKDVGLRVKDLKITGDYRSPEYYNFSTDVIDFDLIVYADFEQKMIEALENDLEDFQKYLHDNFSDRDGFWSFTPNNWSDFKDHLLNKGDQYEQSVGAGITYLVGSEALSDLEYYIYGEALGNGYQTSACSECDSEDLEYSEDDEGGHLTCLKCGTKFKDQ